MGETIKERTIAFVKSKGITMKKFEQACGLSSGYVTSMRKGFGQEKLESVLNAFPELNRDWLLYGDGMMTNSIHNGIPEYDVDFSCGNAVMYTDSTSIVGTLSMSEYANATAIVRATGNSMHPLITIRARQHIVTTFLQRLESV